MIRKFRTKLKKDGRSLVWFHKNFITGINYPYFIIQLHDPERMHPEVWEGIYKYLSQKSLKSTATQQVN
ncbi:MAG: hypothetical protein DRH32_08755 [Deltaproteobacteria bacterium]|nr:MAG: hypothetical protein DRH93_08410 [Deltaproteobacteria bacterium]RLC28603.1 MAG: hypothetical protein DRH32_08755 [Deltaproteobacteria bacterium]